LQSNRPLPITRDLVLLGGGHAHALVLKKWAMAPLPGAQVTLVNPDAKAPYTGMLPGFVAGHYQRADLDIDMVRRARQAGARLIIDRAIGIDTEAKTVQLKSRPDICYDTLSIDIGITSALMDLPGASDHLVPAKPLGQFADSWSALIEDAQLKRRTLNIAVIGAGVAGIELALAMDHRLKELGISGTVGLIEAADTILREASSGARRKLISELKHAEIEVITETTVTAFTEQGFCRGPDDALVPADFIVSTAGAMPHCWLSETSLDLEAGYIAVAPTLRSTNTPNVFATGDCAHLTHAPRPKAGVFAVRQAPVLFENLCADLADQPLRNFTPQKSYLKLISTGRKSAITDKWGIGLSGKRIWRLKNRIDQAFMDQFRHPTNMEIPDLPARRASGLDDLYAAHTHQCGACGAKVAQGTLEKGLDNALDGSLEDAAIINHGATSQVFSTDHLRAFNQDPYTLAKVAAIHALGDIWAMGATPDAVLAHIVLPPLSPKKQAQMMREIMAGAGDVFSACDTKISGGHTSSGAELTIGFSIAGNLDHAPITQSGASPGDCLILTKPIGTGVLLAAEMRQLADGDDYQAALTSMTRLQSEASSLLRDHATALTDVTGFGLAGHLFNILNTSGVAARIDLSDIPLLEGALNLASDGVRSTLWPSNAERAEQMTMTASPLTDLLFDPQTCGGLLATIPAAKTAQVFEAFEAAEAPIWKIGDITQGAPHIEVQ
jgi:selenide, water dikinase